MRLPMTIVIAGLALLLGACMPKLPPPPENAAVVDGRIVREARAAIDRLDLMNTQSPIEVTSEKGIVKVDGIIYAEHERYKILDAVEAIEGVRHVRDSLHRPDPGRPKVPSAMRLPMGN